jgi:hypothetical protein
MNKRFASVLTIMTLLFSLFPSIASAAASDYLVDNGVLIKYTGKATNIVIPKGVTTIAEEAFFWTNNSRITSITMPDSVTTIERRAIQCCTSLTKLTLSKNLKIIGEDAFSGCTKLKTVNLPYGLERIEVAAFGGCDSLVNMSIPATVKYIGHEAVDSLAKGKEFVVLGDGILYKYNGKGGNVVIPKNVKIIGEQAFAYMIGGSIKSVTIPGNVREIWDDAFLQSDDLTRVTLSEGIKKISPSAFYLCSKLKEINIPKSLEDTSLLQFRSKVKLGNQTEDFDIRGNNILYKYNGKDADVVIPQGVKKINGGAFYGNKSVNSVKIPDGVESIGESAFCNCIYLSRVEIPDSVKSIGASAFDGCSWLSDVELPDSLTFIEERAFTGTNITGITIPNTVTSIGESAFGACYKLRDVKIPEGVVSIGKNAFDLTLVNGLIIPKSVTCVGKGAFGNKYTTDLTFLNGNTRIDELAFYGSGDRTNVTITAPTGGSVQRMAARHKLKFKALQ